MISFNNQYNTLRQFIDAAFHGKVKLQEIIFGYKMEEPIPREILRGAERFIIDMDIDHIPNTMNPLMHNMLENENYWFFYEALTKHDIVDLDNLPKPKTFNINYARRSNE